MLAPVFTICTQAPLNSCPAPPAVCILLYQILGYDAITWQKILPLGFMFFCILFNYTILRDTKVRCGRNAAASSLQAYVCSSN